MQIRMHRGGYDESMATVAVIEPTREAIIAYLDEWLAALDISAVAYNVTLEHYGVDARNGWDTHLLCFNGHPVAFTDGPLGA